MKKDMIWLTQFAKGYKIAKSANNNTKATISIVSV